MPRTFLDSNILLYAEDAAFPEKQRKALDLVVEHRRQRTGVISTQVLGEFFHVATRRLKLDPAIARAQVEFHSRFELVEPSLADTLGAIDLHRLYGYSYLDSLVLRCASVSGCKVLLSEDMQHGQTINGVRIINPFA
ncbi:MAG TPA: PIN domain-containing protein [Terracidiphilus sp.]|jgi:predicted nucleic acid-binding protein